MNFQSGPPCYGCGGSAYGGMALQNERGEYEAYCRLCVQNMVDDVDAESA